MKLFAKPEAIAGETEKLRTAEKYRREDRAIVSDFYNGAPPLSDSDAEELGFTVNCNHLFGYEEIAGGADQMFGLYTKPANLIEVSLDMCPAHRRIDVEQKAAAAASRVFRKITGFKSDYQGVCGDGAMHGEALFFFPNKTFPLPKQCPLSKMLIPDDSSTDVHELTHWGIEHKLTMRDLVRLYDNPSKGWNKANLRTVLNRIYEGVMRPEDQWDGTNAEEFEYKRQENSATNDRRETLCDATYFYQQRPEKPGMPYDLTIMVSRGSGHEADPKASTLYEGEGCVENIRQILHPFFMDCIIGGAPKWHRVLGMGHLNYDTNRAVELLVNRAQQATMEGSMNIWQVKDASVREGLQQILLKHNGIVPDGMNLIPNRFAPNLTGIFESIQFFRQAGAKNATGITPNSGQKNDQLEVQAVAEMNMGASRSNLRTSNWYDYYDVMWTEAFRRLTNPYIEKNEPGYSEVMDFQAEMRRERISLIWLQPNNVTVKAVRIVGDGVRQKELGIVQYLTTNRNQYAPEVQPRITRLVTSLATDNYKLAEELTPIEEEIDSPQTVRAENENAIMLTQRKPQAAKVDDIDEPHIMAHFPAMEMLIADALKFQKGAFTPQQAESFQVIGGHIVVHIKRIEGKAQNTANDPEREAAAKYMEQLNKTAAIGEKLMKNMQGAQESGQEQPDPMEIARLQLDSEKLQLQREKMQHGVESKMMTQRHREQVQATKDQALAFDQNLKLETNRREDQRTATEAAARDAELALKIRQAAKPDRQSK